VDKEFISKRFSSIRIAHNISARQLSLSLGQSPAYINQIECEHKSPSIDGLLNFCEYFNMPLAEFFDDGAEYPVQYKSMIKDMNKLSIDELGEVSAIIKRIVHNKK
jgi:transcriptional regulator with XRE-family HTH domain